ncbi:MAG: aspartate--tRNA ligase, partial [Rhodospirillaceae bacterium]|nr:aspartate--tRNA ligase [Rhodospirillaceae bacterium]
MHIYRSHTCGALRSTDVGQTARISGWVHRKRDHGGLLFIDLRDNYGVTQCVIEPDSEYFAAAEAVRPESVLRIDGAVLAREAETINKDLPTGEIEIRIAGLELLSAAE